MHEDTPTRVATIATVGGTLTAEITAAIAASTPFIASSGAATSQLRAELQLGNLLEEDETLRTHFANALRTVGAFERIARETAAGNQRVIGLSRQFDDQVALIQARLAELQNPPPEGGA